MNNIILVGRLTKDPELIEDEKGYKRTFITIAVPRNYKNSEGVYDCDFVRCIIWNKAAEHTCEYCKKGDVVGIKGKIETSTYEKEGTTRYESQVVVEKISFLSSKKITNEENEIEE